MKKFFLLIIALLAVSSSADAAKIDAYRVTNCDSVALCDAKVYAAGIGDMNDLLENPVLIGKMKDVLGS